MEFLEFYEGSTGEAADTGSAVHLAARGMHEGLSPPASVVAMRAAAGGLFPLADLALAERQFLAYAADRRNSEAEVVLCEENVILELVPAPEDPTGELIVVSGHPDQVRRVPGGLQLIDLKTGQRRGWDMIGDYAHQLAAYQVAVSAKLGERVEKSVILRTRDYIGQGGPVFWECPWDYDGAVRLLDGVRRVVAAVRAGASWPSPGEHCKICPARGIDRCLHRHRDVFGRVA